MNSGEVNWGRANKTTLLALIRLQNKAVRTLEYNKTKAKTTIFQAQNFRNARYISIVSCQIHVFLL